MNLPDWVERVGWRLFMLLVPVLFVVVPVLVVRRMRIPFEKKFKSVYEGLSIRSVRSLPDDVSFLFHTYDGVLIHGTMFTHKGYGQLDDVRELLKRLHRYNMTYGWLCPGTVLIPMLSIWNYRYQLRSVTKQTKQQKSNLDHLGAPADKWPAQ